MHLFGFYKRLGKAKRDVPFDFAQGTYGNAS